MSSTRRSRTAAASNGTRPDQDGIGDESASVEEPLAFEEALGRLDETVAALEGGQIPLEDALRLFEEGVRMAQRCQQMLDDAELRMQRLRVITEGEGDQPPGSMFVLDPFELEDE